MGGDYSPVVTDQVFDSAPRVPKVEAGAFYSVSGTCDDVRVLAAELVDNTGETFNVYTLVVV